LCEQFRGGVPSAKKKNTGRPCGRDGEGEETKKGKPQKTHIDKQNWRNGFSDRPNIHKLKEKKREVKTRMWAPKKTLPQKSSDQGTEHGANNVTKKQLGKADKGDRTKRGAGVKNRRAGCWNGSHQRITQQQKVKNKQRSQFGGRQNASGITRHRNCAETEGKRRKPTITNVPWR